MVVSVLRCARCQESEEAKERELFCDGLLENKNP